MRGLGDAPDVPVPQNRKAAYLARATPGHPMRQMLGPERRRRRSRGAQAYTGVSAPGRSALEFNQEVMWPGEVDVRCLPPGPSRGPSRWPLSCGAVPVRIFDSL